MIEALGGIRQRHDQNIWWQLIDLFLENYRDETEDSILPVGRAINRFYEFTAEQRREKMIGHGIFLGTVHSSKGMQFPHVLILDSDWGRQRRPKEWEKELSDKRYALIGLDEVYMDYAGCFSSDHVIHKHIASLEVGHRVTFRPSAKEIEIHSPNGGCVAKLSKVGAAEWSQRLNQVFDLRVVALLRRNRDDPQEGFRDRIKTDWWELPVLEAVYTPSQKRRKQLARQTFSSPSC